jgi:hypothetical protein
VGRRAGRQNLRLPVNRTVSLTKRVTTDKGPRYCPLVIAANGRMRPDSMIVNDKPEHHPEGAYYISWYEGKTLKRKSVDTDANAAAARQHRQQSMLNARQSRMQFAGQRKL